jgi:hypothetical protein
MYIDKSEGPHTDSSVHLCSSLMLFRPPLYSLHDVGFEILTAVDMKSSIIWDMKM